MRFRLLNKVAKVHLVGDASAKGSRDECPIRPGLGGFLLHRDQERMEEIDNDLDVSENLCQEGTGQKRLKSTFEASRIRSTFSTRPTRLYQRLMGLNIASMPCSSDTQTPHRHTESITMQVEPKNDDLVRRPTVASHHAPTEPSAPGTPKHPYPTP
jgi:hypothetical protein